MIKKHFSPTCYSIRYRIMFLAALIAFFSAGSVGVFSYLSTVEYTQKAAIKDLANEAQLIALQFRDAHEDMMNDTFIVSRTPPIKGLMRTLKNNDIDPKDGSTTRLWRERLETIFKSVMTEQTHYFQMRYIGLANNGKELVRVNRTPEGLAAVPEDQLQEKANEPYMEPLYSSSDVTGYFSEVTYNKEHGTVDSMLKPTVRVIWPVYNDADEVYGAIIINADYPLLLTKTFERIKPNKRTYAFNYLGDVMEYIPDSGAQPFIFHNDAQFSAPEIINELTSIESEALTLHIDKSIAYGLKTPISSSNQDAYIGVAIQVPKDQLMAPANAIRDKAVHVTLTIVAISVVIALLFAMKLARPLQKMSRKISQATSYTDIGELPTHMKDETGDLARAFTDMIEKIRHAEEEREELIASLSQSNNELDQFAHVASHDLKAPLRVIDNASRWIEEDLGDALDEESKENLALMRNRVHRMERLLDDLLEYSSIGRKLNDQYAEKITGELLFNDILALLSPPKGFTIIADDTFRSLHINRMPLQQIIYNLIGNALKHHDKKSGTIVLSAEEQDEHYLITVKDDGPGIPLAYQEKVFGMFQTLKPRDQVEGSGMGLAMVKKHIEHFGESITLSSPEGEGCTFSFTWPKNADIIIEEVA